MGSLAMDEQFSDATVRLRVSVFSFDASYSHVRDLRLIWCDRCGSAVERSNFACEVIYGFIVDLIVLLSSRFHAMDDICWIAYFSSRL